MTGARKPPNIFVPAAATVVALLDLVVCLSMPEDSPSRYGMVWSEVGLIVLAIIQWVLYFRLYIDFRIDQTMQQTTLPLSADQAGPLDPQ